MSSRRIKVKASRLGGERLEVVIDGKKNRSSGIISSSSNDNAAINNNPSSAGNSFVAGGHVAARRNEGRNDADDYEDESSSYDEQRRRRLRFQGSNNERRCASNNYTDHHFKPFSTAPATWAGGTGDLHSESTCETDNRLSSKSQTFYDENPSASLVAMETWSEDGSFEGGLNAANYVDTAYGYISNYQEHSPPPSHDDHDDDTPRTQPGGRQTPQIGIVHDSGWDDELRQVDSTDIGRMASILNGNFDDMTKSSSGGDKPLTVAANAADTVPAAKSVSFDSNVSFDSPTSVDGRAGYSLAHVASASSDAVQAQDDKVENVGEQRTSVLIRMEELLQQKHMYSAEEESEYIIIDTKDSNAAALKTTMMKTQSFAMAQCDDNDGTSIESIGNKARVSARPEMIKSLGYYESVVSPISDQDSNSGNEDEIVSDKENIHDSGRKCSNNMIQNQAVIDEEMDPVIQSSWSSSSSPPPPQILCIPQSRAKINKHKKKNDDAASMIKGVLRVQPRYSGGSPNEVVNNRRKTSIKRSEQGRSSDHDSSSIDNESNDSQDDYFISNQREYIAASNQHYPSSKSNDPNGSSKSRNSGDRTMIATPTSPSSKLMAPSPKSKACSVPKSQIVPSTQIASHQSVVSGWSDVAIAPLPQSLPIHHDPPPHHGLQQSHQSNPWPWPATGVLEDTELYEDPENAITQPITPTHHHDQAITTPTKKGNVHPNWFRRTKKIQSPEQPMSPSIIQPTQSNVSNRSIATSGANSSTLAVDGIMNSTNGGGKRTMKKDSGGGKFSLRNVLSRRNKKSAVAENNEIDGRGKSTINIGKASLATSRSQTQHPSFEVLASPTNYSQSTNQFDRSNDFVPPVEVFAKTRQFRRINNSMPTPAPTFSGITNNCDTQTNPWASMTGGIPDGEANQTTSSGDSNNNNTNNNVKALPFPFATNNDGSSQPHPSEFTTGSGMPKFKWWTWKQQNVDSRTESGSHEEDCTYFAFLCMLPNRPV